MRDIDRHPRGGEQRSHSVGNLAATVAGGNFHAVDIQDVGVPMTVAVRDRRTTTAPAGKGGNDGSARRQGGSVALGEEAINRGAHRGLRIRRLGEQRRPALSAHLNATRWGGEASASRPPR